MTRNDTLKFLTNLQRFGWRLGLENISKLLAEMGNPHFRFKCVHIAGTNGKGSTAALLESMFCQAGYKTGLFTSPHLLTVSERIKVNGHAIAIEKLVSYVERLKDAIQTIGCTYFEALTAVAFQYFADVGVHLAFIEVGLGGRHDATNVITPVLSIITNIDLEHSEHLGWTKRKIAEEKAGIIKYAVPCLSGSKNQAVNAVLRNNAEQKHASFHKLADMCTIYPQKLTENFSEFNLVFFQNHYNQLKVGLAGRHQLQNAALAVAAVEILAQKNIMIKKEDIKRGLLNVQWPGRLEKLQEAPTIVVDVAHNRAAISTLLNALRSVYNFDSLIFIIGLLKDKNYKAISKLIAPKVDFIGVTTPDSDRALSAQIFGDEIARFTHSSHIFPNIQQAFQWAKSFAKAKDLICVTGSHYIVGEFLNFYKKS